MRKLKWIVLGLGVLTLAFFALAPGIVERSMNRMVVIDLPKVDNRSQTLHERLFVADMHADTLLWKRSLSKRANRGHADIPRLQDGNVALQVFATVTKSPASLNYDSNSADSDTIGLLAFAQLQPPRTWNSLLQRSLWHARRLHDVAKDDARLMMVKTKSDLRELQQRRAAGEAVMGGMLGVEGLHNLEAQATNLQVLFDAGYRMAGLTHFFDNALAGSMHGLEKGGLTDFGRGIVREMEAMGMAIDIAHLSPKAVDEVLAMATRPIVVSHGGVKALCNANRNLTDTQIRGVAATGGVIGIGYWPGAICNTHPDAVAAAMLHVVDLVGIDHVGLGSDYDGAVQVAFDTSALALITGALQRQGLSDREIAQVMGGNVVRVLSETLPD